MLLYLHIPFCDSKCNYCAFNSYVDKFELKKSYMSAIITQLKSEIDRYNIKKDSIETIFIGGGTPSTIDPKLYEIFFKTVSPYIQKDAEITTEANPNSATTSWLQGMKNLGVNRISFGIQSFNDHKLKILGRNHNSLIAKNAIKKAMKIGYENISIDLIYGTSLDNQKLLQKDLDIAFSFPINHLSAYSLTIEKDTLFYKKDNIQNDDEDLAKWFIDSIPLPQYEISNFGTYRSKHNLGYWQYKDYIGIGAGAVGFLKNKRFYTQKSIESYIKNPNYITIENLDNHAIKSEKILLGARSVVGFSKELLTKEEMKKAMLLVEERKLNYKNNYFYNQNYLLSDEIALYLIS